MQTPDYGWLPAVVRQKCTEPRSWRVETSDGAMSRRNRGFLRESELIGKSVDFHAEQNIINVEIQMVKVMIAYIADYLLNHRD